MKKVTSLMYPETVDQVLSGGMHRLLIAADFIAYLPVV
jgi:hypothetical protein